MITSYKPVLSARLSSSMNWYTNFHNIYYLSQLSGLSLLTYIESMIESFRDKIIIENKDYLIKNKIISAENNLLIILDEDKFKSLDVKLGIEEIIEGIYQKNFEKLDAFTMVMGLKIDDTLNIDIKHT